MVLREWKEFEDQVLDPTSGPVQRGEMRMALISGAFAALGLLNPTKFPTELHAECHRLYREFAALVEDEYERCKSRRARATDTRPTNRSQGGASQ